MMIRTCYSLRVSVSGGMAENLKFDNRLGQSWISRLANAGEPQALAALMTALRAEEDSIRRGGGAKARRHNAQRVALRQGNG